MYKRKVSDEELDKLYQAYIEGDIGSGSGTTVYGDTPVGTVIAFMGKTPPDGYVACDGSEYETKDWPDFVSFLRKQFNDIHYFGTSDDDDHFKVPDLRGEFLRGTGTQTHDPGYGADYIYTISGDNVGKHQQPSMFGVFYSTNSNSNKTLDFNSPSINYSTVQTDGRYGIKDGTRKRINIDTTDTVSPSQQYWIARPTNTSVLYCINIGQKYVETVPEEPLELYCYRRLITQSDPAKRIEYVGNNASYTPAKMNFSTGKFEYGSWANAFFMKVRPCMLNKDGTVYEYLDENNYKKTVSGAVSKNTTATGSLNCMIEFPLIWVKREQVGNYQYVYIANKQVDSNYYAYSNTDANGNIIPHFYYAAYSYCLQSNVMRSISGQAVSRGFSGEDEVKYATANNPSGKNMWYTSVASDWMLICDLLRLISKSTDMEATFGRGAKAGNNVTGLMDDKGLFFGDSTGALGVKLFGIEHFYGENHLRIWGYMYDSTTKIQSVKMTWDKSDGSSVVGYNTTGNGYIKIAGSAINDDVAVGNIVNGLINQYGYFPIKISAPIDTTTMHTYECARGASKDYTGMAVVGGCSSDTVRGFSIIYHAGDMVNGNIVASLSCKPLAA